MSFCNTCSKLAILFTNKSCMRCKGMVYNNISVLCDSCSIINNKCSSCLKYILKNKIIGGCKGCGQ